MKYFIAGLLFFVMAPAQAMTFASGAGTDNAGCGAATSPCRTLQQAVTNAPAGGYVVLQGPADFGPVIIEKSISIVGENGATVRATPVGEGPVSIEIAGGGDASKVVRLRGLAIEGNAVGKVGVVWLDGARMEIADCVIRDFSFQGIYATPRLSTNRSLVSVSNTVIENTDTAFFAQKSPYQNIGVSVHVDGLRARNNRIGVVLLHEGATNPAVRAVVINSDATNNSSAGFAAYLRNSQSYTPPPRDAGLLVVKSTASGNVSGIVSGSQSPFDDADGAVSLSRSVIVGNNAANGGTKLAYSFGGNVIRGNADDTLSRFSLQQLH